MVFSLAALADDAGLHFYTLDPIIVTAQKRPEYLYAVPISVSIVDNQKTDALAIRNLEDLSAYTSNVNISQGAVFGRVFIRGIGSGLNQGFEQSVATFTDNVYTGRDRQTRIPLLDVARVEVLKGPQGILFGKNTTAGAINIITAQPGPELETRLSTLYAPDHGEQYVEGVVSGPIAEGISARVAARVSGLDGYLFNTALKRNDPSRQDQVFRGIIRWDGREDLDVTAKYEYAHSGIQGRSSQVVDVGAFGTAFTALDPRFDADFNERRSVGSSSPPFGPDVSDTVFHNGTITIDANIGDHSLTSITAYTNYAYDDLYDLDLSALSAVGQQRTESFNQFSQEIRLRSPASSATSWLPWDLDAIDYLVGSYYHYQDLELVTHGNLSTVQIANLGFPFPSFAASRVNKTEQKTNHVAVFGQATWHPAIDWRVTAGLRYTWESKKASKNLIVADLGTQTVNQALQPFFAAFSTFPHNFQEARSESHITPMFGLQWNVSPEDMLYFSFSTAYKSGGFDDNAVSGKLSDYEFDEEFAIGYELGAKTSWLDGALRLDLALFRTNFEDLQVSAFDGFAAFVVGNAAAATTQGIELEGRWQAAEGLSISTSVAYLDAHFDEFKNAACTAVQTASFAASGAPSVCIQDLSGKKTPYAPEWSGSVVAEYVFPLARLDFDSAFISRLNLATLVNVNFSDAFFLAEDLDPLLKQNAFAKLNVRIALADNQGYWELAFLGRNLTNELTSIDGNDIPVLAGALRKSTERPRTLAIQARLSF